MFIEVITFWINQVNTDGDKVLTSKCVRRNEGFKSKQFGTQELFNASLSHAICTE